MKTFAPKVEDMIGKWRTLPKEELNELYCSPNIVQAIESRRMRWAKHVTRTGGEKRCIQDFVKNLTKRDYLEHQSKDERIILNES
jgi:hypothetical protein